MAQRTIAHMYDDYNDAQRVVTELESAGIPHNDISLVANAEKRGVTTGQATTTAGVGAGAMPGETVDHSSGTGASTGAGAGAVVGTALGGGLGLLAGIGSLAIPGVGPVVAAGWLVATLTGAGIGAASLGLVGSLTGAGLSKDEADVYAHGVKGGASLVTVRANDSDAARIEDIMGRHGPVDWRQRRDSYGADWKGFSDSSVEPATTAGSATDPMGRDTTGRL